MKIVAVILYFEHADRQTNKTEPKQDRT